MNRYSLTHLGDGELNCSLKTVVARGRASDADVLAHIAEFDERRLYLPAAYPCMKEYCIRELRFSEDAASKRVYAARAARQFPAIFAAVAEGRLHLSGVVTLAPRLTPENADELLEAATHKTRDEILHLLAERFPKPDLPARLGDTSAPTGEQAPDPVGDYAARHAPGHVESPGGQARILPLSAERSALQCSFPRRVEEKIRYARTLASHQLPSGVLATLIEWCVDAFIEKQEKQKFAATARPRSGSRRGASARHIPAAVKRAVCERDQGRCTFVSDAGKRCTATWKLGYDHEDPVACGGQATVANLRLLCRAHNQYAAACAFGTTFMNHKRQEARTRRAEEQHAPGHPGHGAQGSAARGRMQETQHAPGHVGARALGETDDRDVIPWLRKLGVRLADARRAAEACESMPEASLEERVRYALSLLAPSHRKVAAPLRS
ncbi:MAG: hypothetical protein E6K72_04420 [Candidatus Eisenbacteria bacterium]|uniref:HNH endonuclease n=1 Tax=Eiseniibacteriota bacterium TaxID=2212470 RepID=A0A538SZJ7_UNCEI|nr:MAG: hypothetical protein E6K72_04420 [Candidatus Eisenbacteria bacterium]